MATNIINWIEENKANFTPPVCNKLLHAGQLKIMVIGSPNIRKDYHIEEGEELFYQFKGDMCLKVMEKGKPKDIIIKEGEIFFLPSYIPHSPNRPADTLGLVIERERFPEETDGLRYYNNELKEVIFEEWFYCYDLGSQLKPVIEKYFASEAHKTGKAIPGTIGEAPYLLDTETELPAPVPLASLLSNIDKNGITYLQNTGEFTLRAITTKELPTQSFAKLETWFWQQTGSSKLTLFKDVAQEITLGPNDVYTVLPDVPHKLELEEGSLVLEVQQNPEKNTRKSKQ